MYVCLDVNLSVSKLIDLELVYDLAPQGNFQGYDFLNTHGSWHLLVKVLQSSVGALMSYATLKYRPLLFSGQNN